MRIGDVVTIYEDPLTRKKVEGRAKLRRLWQTDNENRLEYWEVRFPEGFVADRWVVKAPTVDKNKEALDGFFNKI